MLFSHYGCHLNSVSSWRGCFTKKHVINQATAVLRWSFLADLSLFGKSELNTHTHAHTHTLIPNYCNPAAQINAILVLNHVFSIYHAAVWLLWCELGWRLEGYCLLQGALCPPRPLLCQHDYQPNHLSDWRPWYPWTGMLHLPPVVHDVPLWNACKFVCCCRLCAAPLRGHGPVDVVLLV